MAAAGGLFLPRMQGMHKPGLHPWNSSSGAYGGTAPSLLLLAFDAAPLFDTLELLTVVVGDSSGWMPPIVVRCVLSDFWFGLFLELVEVCGSLADAPASPALRLRPPRNPERTRTTRP